MFLRERITIFEAHFIRCSSASHKLMQCKSYNLMNMQISKRGERVFCIPRHITGNSNVKKKYLKGSALKKHPSDLVHLIFERGQQDLVRRERNLQDYVGGSVRGHTLTLVKRMLTNSSELS